MPITSNSLIHFTNKQNLLSIFQETFKIHYCKEKAIIGGSQSIVYVPMVSFCDIPLSQIKDNISKYGDYGIGLSREWAIRNKLNPVLYIEKDSNFSKNLDHVSSYFLTQASNIASKSSATNIDDDYFNSIMSIVNMRAYIKNFQADLERVNKETINDYRFADEREWRYVPEPTLNQLKGSFVLPEDRYQDIDTLHPEVKSLKLDFSPDDIKYIIIKSENEISEFIAHLRESKTNGFSEEQIDRLTTRILTTEQIKEDF